MPTSSEGRRAGKVGRGGGVLVGEIGNRTGLNIVATVVHAVCTLLCHKQSVPHTERNRTRHRIKTRESAAHTKCCNRFVIFASLPGWVFNWILPFASSILLASAHCPLPPHTPKASGCSVFSDCFSHCGSGCGCGCWPVCLFCAIRFPLTFHLSARKALISFSPSNNRYIIHLNP